MPQFYMLSILANLAASLVLAGDYLGAKIPWLAPFAKAREKRVPRIVVAVCALVIGVIKFFVLSPGEHLLIIGDLLPALAGVVLGVLLLAEAHPAKVEQAGERISRMSKTALTYRVPVGIAGIVIALLHFLFPGLAVL